MSASRASSKHQLKHRQPLILYGSGSQFRQTNAVEGELGEGTGGVTEAYKRRIILPFAGPIKATDHVLGHEIVHAFQYNITDTSACGAAAGNAGAQRFRCGSSREWPNTVDRPPRSEYGDVDA